MCDTLGKKMTLNSSNAEELPLFPHMYTAVVLRNSHFCTVDKTILENNNIKLDDNEMGLTLPHFHLFIYLNITSNLSQILL